MLYISAFLGLAAGATYVSLSVADLERNPRANAANDLWRPESLIGLEALAIIYAVATITGRGLYLLLGDPGSAAIVDADVGPYTRFHEVVVGLLLCVSIAVRIFQARQLKLADFTGAGVAALLITWYFVDWQRNRPSDSKTDS